MKTDHSRDIVDVLKRHANQLLSVPHVLGVDVGPKIVGGVQTDEMAIRVKVAVKLPVSDLPREYLLPVSIEGYPVDIVEERSDFANTVLRSAMYDQLSRDRLERSLDQSRSLETSDLPDHFRTYVDSLLKGWLTVTILSSAVALLFIIISIWSVVSRNLPFAAVSGGVTIVDLIALAVLKPWEKYQRALVDERVIEKATSILNAQLEELRESHQTVEQVNELRNQYLSSWLRSVDRFSDANGT